MLKRYENLHEIKRQARHRSGAFSRQLQAASLPHEVLMPNLEIIPKVNKTMRAHGGPRRRCVKMLLVAKQIFKYGYVDGSTYICIA